MAERAPAIGGMDLDEFRRYGHEIVDWIADYLAHPERYPVLSRAQPGEISSQLPPIPPEQAEPMAAILGDFEKIIAPGITHWNHPGFHAYFSVSGSAPGILGEMLTAALNVNAMLWRTSPSATELEEVTLKWLRMMLGMDDGWFGVITDGASASSLLAIAADGDFRLDPQALAVAIKEDLAAGWRPFLVTATVGTTATTSVDPVAEIAAVYRQHGLWLHVDGADSPERRLLSFGSPRYRAAPRIGRSAGRSGFAGPSGPAEYGSGRRCE